MADKFLAKPSRRLLQLAILGVYMRRINYDSATVNISVFIEQRNISFHNDVSLKTMRLGVLSWEKLKHREIRCRIVSLPDQLRLGVEEQLLMFSSCLSPGRVKKLQKFINFCHTVGHSANLNIQSPHEDNRTVTPVKCTKLAHRDGGTGTIYDSCRFDIGRFRLEPTDLRNLSDKFAYRRAHNNLFLTLRVIQNLKIMRKNIIFNAQI